MQRSEKGEKVDFKQRVFGEQKRIIVGVILAATVLLIGYIDNFFLMWLLLGVAYYFAFAESMKLFGKESNAHYAIAAAVWLAAAFYPQPDDLIFPVLIFLAAVSAYRGETDAKLFLPFLYPTASFLFILALYIEYGVMSLLWMLVVVAGSDIGAYFTGRAIGKTKFSPTSPNKTIEGVVGGVAAGVIAGVLVGLFFTEAWLAFIISLAVSLASVFGDLYESYLKRQAGVKDSGTIFPGHGGMLDRVDGYLFGGVILLILLRGLV